jgi:hypothetical protein
VLGKFSNKFFVLTFIDVPVSVINTLVVGLVVVDFVAVKTIVLKDFFDLKMTFFKD